MPADPTSPEAFEARYQAAADPWDFAGSPYEQGRYDAIEAALGTGRFARAFEPGCSVGALTVRLAPRCDHLRAVDVSPSAVARAAERCRDLPSVDLAVGSVDDELRPDAYDLVVFSELGYYVDGEALDALVDGIAVSVAPGGLLVACHWLGTSVDHEVHGSVVHERLHRRCASGFEHRDHQVTPGYVLDAWRRGVTPPRWSVAVVVPARDEEALVGGCIASLLATRVPPGCERWIVVVADRCTDATASLVASRLGDRGEVVLGRAGNVGAARRVGAAAALARLTAAGRPLRSVWLLATDADGTVPLGWIESHLRQADAGAAGVAGTVAVPSFAEHPPEVAGAFADQYVVEADGSHPHVHGANLGVRADAYLDVGGWHHLATGEDHDLWGRLRAAGHPLISTLEAPVLTSGRRAGRAPAGFADLLASLAESVEGAGP